MRPTAELEAPVTLPATEVTATAFTANWQAFPEATSYRLDVAADREFSTLLPGFADVVVADTSEVVTGLRPATEYYFRVRPVLPAKEGPQSAGMRVATLPVDPERTRVTVTSRSLTGEGRQRAVVQVTARDTRDQPISGVEVVLEPVEGGTAAPQQAMTTALGVARFSVAPPDIGSASFRATVAGTPIGRLARIDVRRVAVATADTARQAPAEPLPAVVQAPPEPRPFVPAPEPALVADRPMQMPAPVAVEPSTVTASAFTAHWAAVPGATEYRLEISDSEGFDRILRVLATGDTNQTVTGLPQATRYFYRVRALSESGLSDGSNVVSATTLEVHGDRTVVRASQRRVLADGRSPVTITVAARTAADAPVPGATVTLTARAGSPVIAPASATTDEAGIATFTVTSEVPERVTLAARSGQASIWQTVSVEFARPVMASEGRVRDIELGIRGGLYAPSAGGELFQFVTQQLTATRSDFRSPTIAADLGVWVTDRAKVSVGWDVSRATVHSQVRGVADSEGNPVRQTTQLTSGSAGVLSGTYVVARSGQVRALVGAGGGPIIYQFRQWGNFYDPNMNLAFPGDFKSSGVTGFGFLSGGLEYRIRNGQYVGTELRYQFAKPQLGGAFQAFESIDLSGLRLTPGYSVRF